MYELEVIETIIYSKYNDIPEIKRKSTDEKGKLFKGDKIKVKTKEEADYLCGNNSKKVVACKIIAEPEIEKQVEEAKTEAEQTFRKKKTANRKKKTAKSK